MSRQICNYCKENGHRIHALNPDGERILACPVLIQKEEQKRKKADADFPPLCGSDTTNWNSSYAIASGISAAKKEKNKKEWQLRETAKKEKQILWEQRYEMRMMKKYGPLWFWQVEGTAEDNACAMCFRDHAERERMAKEEENYWNEVALQEAENNKFIQAEREREAKRALMTEAERIVDEQEEEDDLDVNFDIYQMDWERGKRYCQMMENEEKAEYEKNGWPWPPKRGF